MEEAVSVACIDLRYRVYFKADTIKDEKQDTTTIAMALGDTVTENIVTDDFFGEDTTSKYKIMDN